ncbi:nuclear transport factor 2 family protein [Gordonia sp. PP30]|uniref:limonene-1,2-epoxide hydrolase family protein n=1 Tax=Gordonia sp. PP30 TaxID=2935861 RepID=UPI001FFF2E3D|nr:limonene-1,2-epoxide hydrolase family protein [Gordonia sp. PP30]UQE75916.1 nuclear transport factor 2 family protein [Gordonia sp. PP30]
MTSQTPEDLVADFFAALAQQRLDDALASVADSIVYTNVSLPTVRGKKRFAAIMGALNGGLVSFDAELRTIAGNDDGVVLTERIDELTVGPLRIRFWVCGRNEVRDGQIVVWRDYFDFWDCTRGLVRALAGAVVPALNRRPLAAPVSARTVAG